MSVFDELGIVPSRSIGRSGMSRILGRDRPRAQGWSDEWLDTGIEPRSAGGEWRARAANGNFFPRSLE
jgi:hypothetical protein